MYSKKISRFFRKKISIMLIGSMGSSVGFTPAFATPSAAFADRYAAVVVDANSGRTLFRANENARRYPASLTKMMTLYLLFKAMRSRRVSPNTPISISSYAASRPPTKIGLKPGQTIRAIDAAKAIITKSANDIAVAVAEYLGHTEYHFTKMMNAQARRLGMFNTHFDNASGLPDYRNYSTARDLSILALALRKNFPQQYSLFKTTSFNLRGRTIYGHNKLLKDMKGVDGIKTGYTQMSGSNLASSIRINGKSLVAVVMGCRSASMRDEHMAALLTRYLPEARTGKPAIPSILLAKKVKLPSGEHAPIPHKKSLLDLDEEMLTALANNEDTPNEAAEAANNAVIVPKSHHSSQKKRTMLQKSSSQEANRRHPKNKAHLWAIQIGTAQTLKTAQSLLFKAKAKEPQLLERLTQEVPSFEKKGKHYYRARFFGFNDQNQAKKACSILKKHEINCYALQKA